MKLLTKRLVEKPWGKDVLPTPFAAPEGKRIGEVWFEPPPEMPDILVKYIFTSEKLSVQVHPSDAQAKELGESDRGKEECWLVIDADPGATLGVGFKKPVGSDEIRRAALNGSIEDMLAWYPVQAGDFFYIPAGTVHAIGAGVSLIEIQQNSDITYRLYDYGRPRELHLDRGVAVARGEVHDTKLWQRVPNSGSATLVEGAFFTLQLIGSTAAGMEGPRGTLPALVIPLSEGVRVGGDAVPPGNCAMAQSACDLEVAREGSCLVVQAF